MTRAAAIAALLLSACIAPVDPPAGPGLPGGPPAPPKGRHTGRTSSINVGSAGGTVSLASASGGSIAITFPAGALSATTDVTIEELAGNPPVGLVGSAYAVSPVNLPLVARATVTFTAPAGVPIADVTIARQGSTGYWFRSYEVSRDTSSPDPALHTASAPTGEGGSFALVATGAQQDLTGPVQLTNNQEIPFTATGTATLQYLGDDPPFRIYAVTGTLTLQDPVPSSGGGPVCHPYGITPAQIDMPISMAELEPSARFRWGLNGRWDLSCEDGTATFVGTNFDTLGITNPRCTRSWLGSAVLQAGHVQGTYAIDCGARGQVIASWDLQPPP